MSLEYAQGKLYEAVVTMATSRSSLQDRLANAYIYGFNTIGLNLSADLPPELQSSYLEIEKALTKVPGQESEGAVVATTRAMSNDEAQKLIEQLVDLYNEVTQLLGTRDSQ